MRTLLLLLAIACRHGSRSTAAAMLSGLRLNATAGTWYTLSTQLDGRTVHDLMAAGDNPDLASEDWGSGAFRRES